jgi:hypothetical protein
LARLREIGDRFARMLCRPSDPPLMSFASLRSWLHAGLLAAALCGASAYAIDITPAGDLRAAIAALRPGDELVLGGGTYNMSSAFRITVVGT